MCIITGSYKKTIVAVMSDKIDIKSLLEQKAQLVNETIGGVLNDFSDIPERLKQAIEYTLSAPGKRIRAAVVLMCCQAVAGKVRKDAEFAAAAVEMVHTYSLVHDDLPAMDDDDFRRGRPSCHKAFDEATALLTGDALLTMAFEILSAKISKPAKTVEMIKTLAQAAGPAGMVAGQIDDLLAQNGSLGRDDLYKIHLNKTAKMFAASAVLGAIAADASQQQKDLLNSFGLKLGLGFQIADDILDVSSTSAQLGKTAGKDAKQGKLTYPAVFGLEQSEKEAWRIADEAAKIIDSFGQNAAILKELVFMLLRRIR